MGKQKQAVELGLLGAFPFSTPLPVKRMIHFDDGG